MDQNTYTTSNTVLAATLMSLGYPLAGKDDSNPKSIKFCFNKSAGLDRVLDQYKGGEVSVNPQDFHLYHKHLKTAIIKGDKGRV